MPMSNLLCSEDLAAKLRPLYEARGFRRTTPGKFESYSLYMENRNFLDCDHVITFMDMDGNLQALKPDVTLSIVKNIPKEELLCQEKLYYLDEVYRTNQDTREYKVFSQIGVELIGREDPFTNLEVVDLALESLSLMNLDYVLNISHLGFTIGLFEAMSLSHGTRQRVLEAIHAKSLHALSAALEEEALSEPDKSALLALGELYGPFTAVLPRLKALCRNPQMDFAYEELRQLSDILAGREAGHCFFDCSVVNDLDYYNGLLFRGYLKGMPKAVLSGGRYDNLLQRMKKNSCAIGFGINLSEYALYQKNPVQTEFDLLIRYEPGCDYRLLLERQKALISDGARVRLEPAGGGDFPCLAAKQALFTKDNELREVPSC